MKAKDCSVRMIGLLLIGLLTAPLGTAYAQEPVIQIESPAGEPRETSSADPINPAITLPVEITFPIVDTPCVGANPPVITSTLDVYLVRTIDGAVQDPLAENQWPVNTSGWTWTSGPDHVSGTVTIGGLDSGQDRSRYGIKVCIDNSAVVDHCVTGGWVRVERPVADFKGGTYLYTDVTGFSQSPPGCVLRAGLEPAINGAFQAAPPFAVQAPAAGAYPATVSFLGLPLIGEVAFDDSYLDTGGNNVVLGTATAAIDLGPVGLPGYNCYVGGTARGAIYGEVTPYEDLDGQMSISEIEITQSTAGTGTCGLATPDPSCTIVLSIDSDKQ